MAIETKPFDVAEILNSEERISAYLEEAFESGDPRIIASAIGDWPAPATFQRSPETLACREKRSTRRFRRRETRRFPL
jgi:hypothetical protein